MHHCTKFKDFYYPSQQHYQYRYFYPPPVLPGSRTIVTTPRIHSHGVHTHRGDCNIWDNMGYKYASNDLKKVLPWRALPSSTESRTSPHTGRPLNYRSGSMLDLHGTYKFPDLVKASNICAAHGQRTYTLPNIKVSPDEWKFNNRQLASVAEYAHNSTSIMEAEAVECIDETDKEQARRLSETNKDIASRVKDIDGWLSKEKEELKLNINQTHELLDLKGRLEIMIKDVEKPLDINHENLQMRTGRRGAELVHDAVEESLLHEGEILRKNREKLLQELDKVNQQAVQLRAARHDLEMDIRNKEDAKMTDECAKMLTKTASNNVGGLGSTQETITNSSPATWAMNSQNLIHKSQEERNSARVLYSDVSRTMIGCADECFNVWYETNASFKTRISEILEARKGLEDQLAKICRDIDSLSGHIEHVKKAMNQKTPLLKLAQARLDKRKQRPGIELCRDKAMVALHREMYALKQAIDVLEAKLRELDDAMEQLIRTKNSLEHDIKLKEGALFVDCDKCLSLRKNFPISTFSETRYPKRLGSNGLPESRIR